MKMASPEHNVSGNAPAGRKRFWKQANVVPQEHGFAVQLDGRNIRLPGKTPLCVKSRALADALAAEWQAAGQNADGYFTPADLPLTGIAGSMIERIPAEREGVLRSLLAYARSDLLCYREPGEGKLAQAQRKEWDPWLAWLHKQYGVSLHTSSGVMPIAQPEDSLQKLYDVMEKLTAPELAVLAVAVPALGSLVLGLALVSQAGSVNDLVACATLDERMQMAVWGEDTEITDRIASIQREASDAARFLELSRKLTV
ncbi:ATP synthase F1 [Acetobacter aceti 1023]|nr:ATP synthase F1 [Acetobacter aceti 1023]